MTKTGQKYSAETRRRMSESTKGDKNPLFGIGHTEETKRRMSIARSGENNANWKGGISNEPYCDAWGDKEYKEGIKERDKYKCQSPCCEKRSDRLAIHHISYNKKDCFPKNLITLCTSCNAKANFRRRYWKRLFRKIMKENFGYKYPRVRLA